jgi:uncharacterized membrane protein
MSHDNVTPFRRPQKRARAPQQDGGLGFKTHRGRAVLSQGLTLAAFALNFFFPAPPLSFIGMGVGIAAAFIAHSNRGQGMPWANTHHEHALRTLIVGYVIWLLASTLSYIHGALGVATIFIHFAVLIWAAIRSGVGLVMAIMRRAIPHPRGWLL